MDPLLFRASPAFDGFGLSNRPSGGEIVGRALSSALRLAARGTGFDSLLPGGGAMSPEYRQQMQLFELQRRLQHENQIFSTLSNVSKTNHETRMAAVRNMRP
jgi:hypothetical protein